jgi:hypothetical protein
MNAMSHETLGSAGAPKPNDLTGELPASVGPGSYLEGVRSRYLFRAMDAALTAELLVHRAPGAGMRGGVAAGTPRYRGVQRLTGALAAVMPDFTARLRRRLVDTSRLPFEFATCELLAFGSGVTVYLVRPTSGSNAGARVVKVFRKSLGMRREALLGQVRERRAAHRRVMAWYGDGGVVLPTQFLLLHGPLLGRPAAACIQPFVDGPKRDVFQDFTEAELEELLGTNERLRAQLASFTRATAFAAAEEGACVDLLGRGNLVVHAAPTGSELVLLDMGIYEFARKAVRAPAALAAQRERVAYLERMLAKQRA